MSLRRPLSAIAGAAALLFAMSAAPATAAPAPVAPAGAPCGFYKTHSDAWYNHCTRDGSWIVIEVDVSWAPNYEKCVAPGDTWLGSSDRISGAWYTGRLCKR